MIRRLLLLTLGLRVAAPAAIAQETPVTNCGGRLLDGVGDVREGVTITVQGARITDVSVGRGDVPATYGGIRPAWLRAGSAGRASASALRGIDP